MGGANPRQVTLRPIRKQTERVKGKGVFLFSSCLQVLDLPECCLDFPQWGTVQAKSTLSSPSRCWSVVFHSSRKKPNTRRASCRSSEVCLPILPVMSPGCETVVNMFFSLTFAILIVKDFLDLNFFLFCRSQVLSLVCVGFQETDMILRGNSACLTLLRRLCLGVPAGIPSQNKICR